MEMIPYKILVKSIKPKDPHFEDMLSSSLVFMNGLLSLFQDLWWIEEVEKLASIIDGGFCQGTTTRNITIVIIEIIFIQIFNKLIKGLWQTSIFNHRHQYLMSGWNDMCQIQDWWEASYHNWFCKSSWYLSCRSYLFSQFIHHRFAYSWSANRLIISQPIHHKSRNQEIYHK